MRIALGCLRVALGFVLASLAAVLTLVAYALADLESLRAGLSGERLWEAGMLALFVTPWVAACAAGPALAGALFAEVRKVARWWFYALAGVVTAAAGFLLLYEASLPSLYELAAFLTAGLVGGLVYWALAGRYARPRPAPAAPAGAPPPAVAPSA
jgi:uncharacterized membrane protein HdeD (DUF308 family)